MLEYDRIDVSKGIDINKKIRLKSLTFVIVGILKILVLNMNHIFAMAIIIKCKKP